MIQQQLQCIVPGTLVDIAFGLCVSLLWVERLVEGKTWSGKSDQQAQNEEKAKQEQVQVSVR